MMTMSVAMINTEGNFVKTVISANLLKELTIKLRKDGVTEVHTQGENDSINTHKIQAFVVLGKGCNGSVVFVPNEKSDKND